MGQRRGRRRGKKISANRLERPTIRGSLYKDISNNDDNHDNNNNHNDKKNKDNIGFRCDCTVMTGTPQATRTDPDMFDPVMGDMRSGWVRCNFDDKIAYGTIEEEKRTDGNDAARTAQASTSTSASKAAS